MFPGFEFPREENANRRSKSGHVQGNAPGKMGLHLRPRPPEHQSAQLTRDSNCQDAGSERKQQQNKRKPLPAGSPMTDWLMSVISSNNT